MKLIKKNLVAIVLVVLVILGGGYYLVNNAFTEKASQTTASQNQASKIELTVKADGAEKSYQVESAVGTTALAATEKAVKVVKSGEGENAFITSINSRAADDSKKEYWKLIINGKDAQVGAGSYTIKEGDAITWEIATY